MVISQKTASFLLVLVVSLLTWTTTAWSAPSANTTISDYQNAAADCSQPMWDRYNAAARASEEKVDGLSMSTPDAAMAAAVQSIKICDGESVKFGEHGSVLGPKSAGTPISVLEKIDSGTTTLSSSCTYTAGLARWDSGNYPSGTVFPTGSIVCPVIASMRHQDMCVEKRFSNNNTATVACQYLFEPNRPANSTWTISGHGTACAASVDYRTKTNPARFAFGAWAGPGYIVSSNWRAGSIWC